CLDSVALVFFLAIEDVPLVRVDGDVLEHPCNLVKKEKGAYGQFFRLYIATVLWPLLLAIVPEGTEWDLPTYRRSIVSRIPEGIPSSTARLRSYDPVERRTTRGRSTSQLLA